MAATKTVPNQRQQEQTRNAIRTTQLIKRLQWYALGETDDQGAIVDLDANKLRAIDILLKKVLPDLAAVQYSGDQENPLTLVVKIGGNANPDA